MRLWWVQEDFMIGGAVQDLPRAQQVMPPLLLPEGAP